MRVRVWATAVLTLSATIDFGAATPLVAARSKMIKRVIYFVKICFINAKIQN